MQETPHNRFIVAAIASIAGAIASFPASAADSGAGRTGPASPLSAREGSAAPLKGDLRLSPGVIGTGGARLVTPQTNIGALALKFNDLSGRATQYEKMAKNVPDFGKECSAKSYSVQDQVAAGCAESDTVAQCKTKLYKYCIDNVAHLVALPGAGRLGGIDKLGTSGVTSVSWTKTFRQSAQATVADARALSQLLVLYADQVEQNAKTLVP